MKNLTLDLAALRKLAEAATPGPWWWAQSITKTAVATLWPAPDGVGYERPILIPDIPADAAYIAAANPQTVLALLDLIEELEGAARPRAAADYEPLTGVFTATVDFGEPIDWSQWPVGPFAKPENG